MSEEMNDMNNIQAWLEGWCARLGVVRAISQREFTKYITDGFVNTGVYHSTVNDWARGMNAPRVSFLLGVYGRWYGEGDIRQEIAKTGLEIVMPEVFGEVITLESPIPHPMKITG